MNCKDDVEEKFIRDWNEGKVRRVSDGKRMVPEREWQGLTDEEAKEVWKQLNYDLNHGKFAADDTERHVIVEFYRAIEAKLKLKNGYAEEKNSG
jgi:hypothetical protein